MKLIPSLLYFLFFSICFADYVKEINFIGNNHTKQHILKRELGHLIPGKFDSLIASKDRDKIYNLGLFSNVEIYNQDSVYTISVIETFRFIPIPLIEYDEGKGLSYGAGIAFLNFTGLNDQLTIGGISGQEKVYFFDFYNPWIYGNHGSILTEIYQFSTESAIYNYKYSIRGFTIGTGFYINEKHRLNFDLAINHFFMDSTKSNLSKIITYDYLPEYKYLTATLKYKLDTRDIYTDPSKGGKIQVICKPKLGLNSTTSRISIDISYDKYIKLKNCILDPVFSFKSRVKLKTLKDLPIFDKEYIGGEEFVRGYSPIVQDNPYQVQNKMEGVQIFYESFQLQHTLLKRKHYKKIETGIDIIYFFDFGITTEKLNSINFSNIIYGYGVGLRLFLSGAGVISLDIGYNPYGTWFLHPSDGN